MKIKISWLCSILLLAGCLAARGAERTATKEKKAAESLHSSGARIDHVNGEVRGIRFMHDSVDDLLFVAAERAQFLIGRFVVHGE